jgi:hypothetical protein
MATIFKNQTQACQFDDSNIDWHPFGDFKGFVASILHVDEEKRIAEFIIKFDPNTKAILHRHLAPTYTFVIAGDHVIYEPDGSVREVRPVGRFTASGVDGDIHDEGGGPDGCILLYSVRGATPALFEMMDKEFNVTATQMVGDYKAAWDAQRAG